MKLSNEEYDKSVKKFVLRLADPSPRIEITIHVVIKADHMHEPMLYSMLTREFLDKMKYQKAIWIPNNDKLFNYSIRQVSFVIRQYRNRLSNQAEMCLTAW